jgi:N-methylhydantoinase A
MSDAHKQPQLQIGVDVGGTFTDLVAWDGTSLRIVKIPSTPPAFHEAVIDAVNRVRADEAALNIIHGSTVATNALLQRAGEPVAFITTEGFRDMLLIGRQSRPRLYALRVERPAPIVPEENCFTVESRIAADGSVVRELRVEQVNHVLNQIRARGIQHVAVCLLFSFVNPIHEHLIRDRAEALGLTATASADLLPEFREYERASTTAINASLLPAVQQYLHQLRLRLAVSQTELRIMQSGGGTLAPEQASKHAAKLVLSGPAGGVMGAAFVARQLGIRDCITYDMGGTSTDVATIIDGSPQWTTQTTIDGLPIALPMLDIQTVGAGGGSIAYLDAGGALRVGPKSAGADPGPACYARGGTLPTVTDANLVLGRIIPDHFLGGAMSLDPSLAEAALRPLADATNKTVTGIALGIVRIAEANMAHAIRAVTSRRGHDPQDFTLISFGGAGGLHACALAEQLEIRRVIIPPHCGVLSALGMIVAPPVADVSKTVLHLRDQLDDARLAAEFGHLSAQTTDQVSLDETSSVEAHADVRFKGQSHELKIRVERPSIASIRDAFLREYIRTYGRAPENREVEIVTLRLRRIGKSIDLALAGVHEEPLPHGHLRETDVVDSSGETIRTVVLTRGQLATIGRCVGPALLVDPDATSFVPRGWSAAIRGNGAAEVMRQ